MQLLNVKMEITEFENMSDEDLDFCLHHRGGRYRESSLRTYAKEAVYGFRAKMNGVLVGISALSFRKNDLNPIVIVSNLHRGSGIGTLLLDKLVKLGGSCTLKFKVNSDNTPAMKLAEKFSFEIVDCINQDDKVFFTLIKG
jgi:RimJ/RimL family protein N-acetyltransferase